jgi:predicted transcriptional regulator
MLTDFATLSPSDTLADALIRCVHSLQEDFPVVRGSQLVGIVNRQRIVETLRMDGNGYIQGVMSRTFQVAKPEDTLGAIIRRITAGRGLTLIPVAEGEKIVGMVSVQNLMTSMSLLAEQRKLERSHSRCTYRLDSASKISKLAYRPVLNQHQMNVCFPIERPIAAAFLAMPYSLSVASRAGRPGTDPWRTPELQNNVDASCSRLEQRIRDRNLRCANSFTASGSGIVCTTRSFLENRISRFPAE